MKIIKQEKGSITLFVLIAMLFFVMFLVGMYMLSANSESSQSAEVSRIKEIYEQDVNNIDDVYETLVTAKTNNYISDGLVVYYDLNQKNGVQNNILKDLSGNGNDGIINGATVQNGYLQFDGIDDWVSIKELNYSNVTIEAVVEYNQVPSNDEMSITSNFENGGYALSNYSLKGSTPYNKFTAYVTDKYYSIASDNEIKTKHKYYLSGSYDGNKLTLSEDGNISSLQVEGTIKYPLNSTIMVLGTNPYGTSAYSSFFNGKIYAVRIYNRALTEKEIMNNYTIDKVRFEK